MFWQQPWHDDNGKYNDNNDNNDNGDYDDNS